MFHVEQNLSNEIIAILLLADLHPQGLADKLQTNHMTVARKLRGLVDENVVDYRVEGKNKVYYLKKSIEYIFCSIEYIRYSFWFSGYSGKPGLAGSLLFP